MANDTYVAVSASAFIALTEITGCVFRDTAGAVNSRVELYDGYLATPSTAPTGADLGTAGNVNVGSHSWKVTYLSKDGETVASSKSNVVTIATSAKKCSVTIPVGPTGTTGRKVYRTVAGDTGNHKLVTTVGDNTTTSVEDNVADGSLGADSPSTNTTGVLMFVVNIPTANGVESRTLWRPVGLKNPTIQAPTSPYLLVANGTVVGAMYGR